MRKKLKYFLLVICILALILTGYAHYIEPNRLVNQRFSMLSDQIIRPLKIVFFSDTHFGSLYSEKNIEKITAKINAQNPDLVIFGGDFFDVYNKDQDKLDLDYLSGWLSRIDARYGKYAVWGNRDYGGGAERIYEDFMENGGFTILRNESVYLKELNVTLYGLDDYLLGEPDLHLLDRPAASFDLLLSHAPDITASLNTAGFDLALAGHSHGGQVTLPFITDLLLTEGAHRYVKGSYRLEEALLFVSKGIGMTRIPFRFLNTPEIVTIEIKKAH